MTGIPAITDSAGGIFTMIPAVAKNSGKLGINREEFKDSSLFFFQGVMAEWAINGIFRVLYIKKTFN